MYVAVYYFLLLVLWICAWILELLLEDTLRILQSSALRTVYWQFMKLLIWILPALVIWRNFSRETRCYLSGRITPNVFYWGLGAGLLLLIQGRISYLLTGGDLVPAYSISLLSAVLFTPVFEEVVFRGVVLPAMLTRCRFWPANFISSLMFLGAHFPGWYFMGALSENLTRPVGGAASIFLLGLLFGFVTQKTKNAWTGTLTHMLNNLGAA